MGLEHIFSAGRQRSFQVFKKQIRMPILGLFLLSLGGLLLHLRIHPPKEEAFNWIPVICGAVSVIVLPFLFNWRWSVAVAYLLNVAVVVVGTVTMAWHTIEHWKGPVTWDAVLLQSTLADILILLAKLPIAHSILRHFRPRS